MASTRLAEERKRWRKDHPFGFVAKPRSNADGTTNIFVWDCKVPGKEGTIWAGGLYPVTLTFYEQSYPTEPPVVALPATFLHPNVFEGGHICLSIIGKAWRPGISVREILQGVQELLDAPNERDPANSRANALFLNHRAEYERLVREQAKKYAAE